VTSKSGPVIAAAMVAASALEEATGQLESPQSPVADPLTSPMQSDDAEQPISEWVGVIANEHGRAEIIPITGKESSDDLTVTAEDRAPLLVRAMLD
jgi:hypothetical protein